MEQICILSVKNEQKYLFKLLLFQYVEYIRLWCCLKIPVNRQEQPKPSVYVGKNTSKRTGGG